MRLVGLGPAKGRACAHDSTLQVVARTAQKDLLLLDLLLGRHPVSPLGIETGRDVDKGAAKHLLVFLLLLLLWEKGRASCGQEKRAR